MPQIQCGVAVVLYHVLHARTRADPTVSVRNTASHGDLGGKIKCVNHAHFCKVLPRRDLLLTRHWPKRAMCLCSFRGQNTGYSWAAAGGGQQCWRDDLAERDTISHTLPSFSGRKARGGRRKSLQGVLYKFSYRSIFPLSIWPASI